MHDKDDTKFFFGSKFAMLKIEKCKVDIWIYD